MTQSKDMRPYPQNQSVSVMVGPSAEGDFRAIGVHIDFEPSLEGRGPSEMAAIAALAARVREVMPDAVLLIGQGGGMVRGEDGEWVNNPESHHITRIGVGEI